MRESTPTNETIVSERLPLDRLVPGSHLDHCTRLWFDLRGDRRLPLKRDFKPELIGPRLAEVVLIALVGDQFHYRIIGDRISSFVIRRYAGHSLDQVEPASYRALLRRDYQLAVDEAIPVHHRITGTVDLRHFLYDRVLLPLSQEGTGVDFLLSASLSSEDWRDFFKAAAPPQQS